MLGGRRHPLLEEPGACLLAMAVGDVRARRLVGGKENGGIVGFHGVTVDGRGAELEWLFVAPDAIRTGVGRQLYDDARRIAAAAGATSFRIEADPNAVAFYVRIGARLVGEVPSASIPGRVIPVLEADVSSTE